MLYSKRNKNLRGGGRRKRSSRKSSSRFHIRGGDFSSDLNSIQMSLSDIKTRVDSGAAITMETKGIITRIASDMVQIINIFNNPNIPWEKLKTEPNSHRFLTDVYLNPYEDKHTIGNRWYFDVLDKFVRRIMDYNKIDYGYSKDLLAEYMKQFDTLSEALKDIFYGYDDRATDDVKTKFFRDIILELTDNKYKISDGLMRFILEKMRQKKEAEDVKIKAASDAKAAAEAKIKAAAEEARRKADEKAAADAKIWADAKIKDEEARKNKLGEYRKKVKDIIVSKIPRGISFSDFDMYLAAMTREEHITTYNNQMDAEGYGSNRIKFTEDNNMIRRIKLYIELTYGSGKNTIKDLYATVKSEFPQSPCDVFSSKFADYYIDPSTEKYADDNTRDVEKFHAAKKKAEEQAIKDAAAAKEQAIKDAKEQVIKKANDEEAERNAVRARRMAEEKAIAEEALRLRNEADLRKAEEYRLWCDKNPVDCEIQKKAKEEAEEAEWRRNWDTSTPQRRY